MLDEPQDELETIESEVDDELQDGPAATYRIAAYPADFTLEVLHSKYKKDTIRIPSFQRHYVWTLSQASSLVESFLLGLPVPELFLYRDEGSGVLVVIDGQQRLLSMSGFFDGMYPSPDNPRPFRMLGTRPPWEGKLFKELKESDQQNLLNSTLRSIIIEQLSPDDNTSIYHIYKRLNTGGTSLTPQEVRKCVYQGALHDLLEALNAEPPWRAIYGRAKPNPRMRDIELVLRFLTLQLDLASYQKPMNDSLSSFMARHRNATAEELRQFSDLFINTVRQVHTALGERPFRPRYGLNAAVYDSVMVAFARHPNAIPGDIRDRYARLLQDEGYLELVTKATTDEASVRARIEKAELALFGNA